ncbi:competence/damage-inducible protein A [Halopelagius longus]|uniref:Competence/damage-inducible protein A n=1 Tax=Halopelagius longus TaxID=1236180 RepID=A0A1H1BI16_9EURY|nr:molybdopterin-binding protein [Halopelagius longus]RDI70792.1 competence/damage-inducible protein A [Halopelagius longus]SDQ51513.1 competence/damage-inducible protein cinA [Halopelagius longus]
MRVAVVTVGDELLAGDTVNTNAAWLCGRLDARGVDVERVTTIPDRVGDIARVVNEYRAEYDAVVVTGGLGPTHDDLTMEGVAAAVGRSVEEHPEATAWLTEQGGYDADDLAEGTTHLPARARMLPNEEGVAPGAVVEGIYVLPGVPEEMKAMFESVQEEFSGEATYTESIVADEPESELVGRLREVRDRFDVTVGSYPGETVRLKLTATDEGVLEEAAAWLRERVETREGGEEKTQR